MGARRRGQEGALTLPWKICRLDSLQLQPFGSHKKNQNRCTFHRLEISKLRMRPGLIGPDHAGELTVLSRLPAGFKGAASQRIRKIIMERAGRIGDGGMEWKRADKKYHNGESRADWRRRDGMERRDGRRTRKRRIEVWRGNRGIDFAPLRRTTCALVLLGPD